MDQSTNPNPVAPIRDADPGSLIAKSALAGATVGAGLLAGLLYSYQVSVVRALAEVDDAAYVATFRAINRRILNPWFLAVFLGTGPLILAALALNRRSSRPASSLIAAGLLLNGAVLGVTMAANVPLNTALEEYADRALSLGAARNEFERPWNRRNLVRTLAATGSFAALALASATRAAWTR